SRRKRRHRFSMGLAEYEPGGLHCGNHYGCDSTAGASPVARKIKVREGTSNTRPLLTQLVGRHFPPQHRTMVVQCVPLRSMCRCTYLDHDLLLQTRQTTLERRGDVVIYGSFMSS